MAENWNAVTTLRSVASAMEGSALRPCLSTRALPTFLPDFQDSFTSGPRINVTWLSWLSAVGEIGVSLFSAMRGCECGAGRPSSRPAALAKPSSSSLRPRRSFLSDRQSCPGRRGADVEHAAAFGIIDLDSRVVDVVEF